MVNAFKLFNNLVFLFGPLLDYQMTILLLVEVMLLFVFSLVILNVWL
jgi:hypothetical protein